MSNYAEDLDGFNYKYAQVHNVLFRIALSILKDYHKAEDVLQQSAIIGFQNYDKLRNTEAFKSWMVKILVNQCYKQFRLKKELTSNYWDDLEEEKDILPSLDTHITLIKEIEKLDMKYREIILLRFYADLTIKEIADSLNVPKGTIKSRLSRSLLKLKNNLRKDDFDE